MHLHTDSSRRRILALAGSAVALLSVGVLAQTAPALGGRWNPVEPTVAAVPSTRPVDVARSMGGPINITQNGATVEIDNGIVVFTCNPNGPASGKITVAQGPNSMTALLTGRALWEGSKLKIEMMIPNIHRGPSSVLYVSYYLDGNELVVERAVAETRNDPAGEVTKIRYRRTQ